MGKGWGRNEQEPVDDSQQDDETTQPYMHWCHLRRLLRLLENAMMHETKAELDDNKGKDEDADHLMRRVEIFGLQSQG